MDNVNAEIVQILSAIKREMHAKAIRVRGDGLEPYIYLNTVDAIINQEINKRFREKT